MFERKKGFEKSMQISEKIAWNYSTRMYKVLRLAKTLFCINKINNNILTVCTDVQFSRKLTANLVIPL